MRRFLTALILIPAAVYAIFFSPGWLFQLVVAALAFLCFHEYGFIAAAQNVRLPVWLGQVGGLAFLFAPVADWRLAVALALAASLWLLRGGELNRTFAAAAVLLLGMLYIFGAWRCALLLHQRSPWWVFFAVSLNWIGDSAAMFAGKAYGRNKLAPVVSPQKTWEGAIISALAVTAYGTLLLGRVLPATPLWHTVVLSLAAGIAGQLGDLVESAMKRGGGVKDSGNMLPGHGGWLDRLDSTLFSMPVVAFYLAGVP
ncbi:MAG: phosphatidate cytidylyltransferase [Acidobacteria bacterium]|nr:phosphatidate cytidylyltransferase [Acidobacteriota bacterium]